MNRRSRPSSSAQRPIRLRPLALALLTATALTGCEFTQSLFRGRSAIPEAPMNPYAMPGQIVKPPSIVAGPAGHFAPPQLSAPPPGAELLVTPAGRHIAVLPIEGAPQDRGYVIREALAGALGIRVDQATFSAAPQAYRLECRAFLEGGALLLEWRLMDSVGRTLDQAFERQAFVAAPGLDPWSALNDEALTLVGRRSADRLARGLASGVAGVPLPTARPALSQGVSGGFGGVGAQNLGVQNLGVQNFGVAALGPQSPSPYGFAPTPLQAPAPVQPQAQVRPAAPPAAQTPPGGFSLGAVGAPQAPAPAARPPTPALPAPQPPAATAAGSLAQAPLAGQNLYAGGPLHNPGAAPAPAPAAPRPSPAPAPAPARPAASAATGFGSPANTAAVAAAAPIAFRGVFGAPGDGDRSLSAALRDLLARSGERLAPEGTPGAMVLAGQVEKKSGASGDVISITWRLEDAFGGGVGQVLQENEVPRGALDGAWGEDAGYAAEGALDGVKQLIAAARKGPS